jgi:hypothetical protein
MEERPMERPLECFQDVSKLPVSPVSLWPSSGDFLRYECPKVIASSLRTYVHISLQRLLRPSYDAHLSMCLFGTAITVPILWIWSGTGSTKRCTNTTRLLICDKNFKLYFLRAPSFGDLVGLAPLNQHHVYCRALTMFLAGWT